MNFLDICKEVDRMSGLQGEIVSVEAPVAAQAVIVQSVRDAWIDLQSDRLYWTFMRRSISFSMTVGESSYNIATVFGNPVNDFGRWDTRVGRVGWYVTDATTGQTTAIRFLPFGFFRHRYLVGGADLDSGPPTYITADPVDGTLYFSSKADAMHTISADYYMEPQILRLNVDVPILPSRFHKVLAYKGLEYVAGHYTNYGLFTAYATPAAKMHGQLYRDQLPGEYVVQHPIA